MDDKAVMWYKIWNAARTKKFLLKSVSKVESLLQTASEKFNIECKTLALEQCGTVIDDDMFLQDPMASGLTFIALGVGEEWEPISEEKSNNAAAQCPQSRSDSVDILIDHENIPGSSRQESECQNTHRNKNDREIHQFWNTYHGVDIPWDIFADNIQTALLCEKKLTHAEKLQVRTAVVNHIRKINIYVPCKIWDEIAKNLCKKYEKSFQEVDDDGVIIGSGFQMLGIQMRWYNNELNRVHLSDHEENKIRRKTKRHKMDNHCRAGNVENAPDLDSDDSYALIRHEINNGARASDVIKKYENLKIPEEVFKHFNRLTQTDANLLRSTIEQKYAKIFLACNRIKHKESVPPGQDLELLLKKVAEYFREDIRFLINHHEDWKEESMEEIAKSVTTDYPVIQIIDREPTKFIISFDGEIIQEVKDLQEGVMIVLADYHVFNIRYPPNLSRVLEFFQRYALKIHPSVGSRSRAPLINNINPKVLRLIKKIADSS